MEPRIAPGGREEIGFVGSARVPTRPAGPRANASFLPLSASVTPKAGSGTPEHRIG
ncbi:MAG: hypothetical protein ACRDPE_07375 [Solirubrobacterales bacterium]